MEGRERAREMDVADPLAYLRAEFTIPDPNLIYLDGNSLGRPPVAALEGSRDVLERQWAGQLIRGWSEGWLDLPSSVGDELGVGLLGREAGSGEVVACDNTSINLFKLATALLRLNPDRPDIVTDDDNFPTDRYLLRAVAEAAGGRLRLVPSHLDSGVDPTKIAQALDDSVGLVSFSHVAYRSGAIAPQRVIDDLAHAAGARTLWDLSHSVGSIHVDLDTADAAVGCSYKYLSGGPGAPAWLFVRRDVLPLLNNPIPGWFSAREQFAMGTALSPHPDARRFLTGTPDVPGLLRVRSGVRTLAAAGIEALERKGQQLTAFLIELAERLPVRVASPGRPGDRGSHVVLEHPDARSLTAKLIEAGVIPDYREPDRIRFGLAPAYTRFVDVFDGMQALRELLVGR